MKNLIKIGFGVILSLHQNLWSSDHELKDNIQLVKVSKTTYLSTDQRPKKLQNAIASTFETISKSHGNWAYNGKNSYNIAGIDIKEFIITLLQSLPLDQKDFYYMDVGGGNHTFVYHLFERLSKNLNLRPDLTIHLISTTGENYNNHISDEGRFKIYPLDNFSIENVKESLLKHGLDLTNKIDLMSSNFCLLHLHDSVGTFQDHTNLLRLGTGMIITQGFPVYFGNDLHYNLEMPLIQLLEDMKNPYLAAQSGYERTSTPFIMQRVNAQECQLLYEYDQGITAQVPHALSKQVASFKRNIPAADKALIQLPNEPNLYIGDLSLYQWMITHHLPMQVYETSWQPTFTNDSRTSIETRRPPLFYAVYRKDLNELKKLLDGGANLNQQNAIGQHLIHTIFCKEIWNIVLVYKPDLEVKDQHGLTVLSKSFISKFNRDSEISYLLLENGASIHTQDNNLNSLFHILIKQITELRKNYSIKNKKLALQYRDMINHLINKGLSVDIQNKDGDTPLHLSFELQQYDISQLLLNCGAHKDIENKDQQTFDKLMPNSSLEEYIEESNRKIIHLLVENNASMIELTQLFNLFMEQKAYFSQRSQKDYQDLLHRLIDHKIDVNCQDSDGNTALHLAVTKQLHDISKTLIDQGARLDLPNNDSKTSQKLPEYKYFEQYLNENNKI